MPDHPSDGDALEVFAERIELAFQSTSIDHATALGESSEDAIARLRTAVEDTRRTVAAAAEGLVDRLEVAASVQTVGAETIAQSLRDDVEAARDHLRQAVLEGGAQVREAMTQAALAAAASLQEDVADAARQVIPEAAAAAVGEVGTQTTELTAELRTAIARAQQNMAEATESAVARLERVAGTVEEGGVEARQAIVSTAETHAGQLDEAVTGVVARLQQLATSALDIDTRLTGAVDRVREAADGAADRLEQLSDAALSRVIADVGELVGRLQQAGEDSQARLVEVTERTGSQIGGHVDAASERLDTDSRAAILPLVEAVRDAVAEVTQRATGVADGAARESATHSGRLADAAEDLTRTVSAVVAQIAVRTDAVAGAAGQVAEASTGATAAAEQLEAIARRFTDHTDAAVARSTEVGDTMVARFADMMDAAVQASGASTTGNIETLTTTVAWATRTVQGLIERIVDDLASTSATAVTRIDTAGEVALGRIVDLVEDLEGHLVEDVGRVLGPLRIETGRVAEQQAGLAETAAHIEQLMGQREAETARRDAVAGRMEQTVAMAAELVAEGTRGLREEQDVAVDTALHAAEGLSEATDRAGILLAELRAVTGRLEAATAAADASRQALEHVVTRAESLVADAAARRRRASVVPPPGADGSP